MQDPTSTDEQAIAAAQDGDRRAFDQLAQAALPKLRGTIRRMVGHPQQTDDLVQEALTKAWSSIKTARSSRSFKQPSCSARSRS